MSIRITERGNTVTLTFVFYDDTGVLASVTSAEVQLTYPGADDFVTETLTLANDASEWSVAWDSSKSRSGWVHYHAHAYVLTYQYAQKGRFRLDGNRASYDHDSLPVTGTASTSAMNTATAGDYS